MTGPNEAAKSKLIVVGNGMVGHRFCERLVEFEATKYYEITVFGEESRAAYDRVRLSSFFDSRSVDSLQLADAAWYEEHGIRLITGTRVTAIDRTNRLVQTDRGTPEPYDRLVLATGSAPFVPPIPGVDKKGVFVYRTLEDLQAIIEYANGAKSAAVIGGGLLGLEAAKAAMDLGLETTVVEAAPRLMPRQLHGPASKALQRRVEALGVRVIVGAQTQAFQGNGSVNALAFADNTLLKVDLVIVSAGIRPRDELARDCGLEVGPRGGIAVDDTLQTSDPCIYAIGEVALHKGQVYGLVGPGYTMAECVARTLTGGSGRFESADLSTRLKLLGIDVATIGDPVTASENGSCIELNDATTATYKNVVLSPDDSTVLGAMFVGDCAEYARVHHLFRTKERTSGAPMSLITPSGSNNGQEPPLEGGMMVCLCNSVTKDAIVAAVAKDDATTLGAIKKCTKAGTGCGGCVPLVTRILDDELKRLGRDTKRALCPHFQHTRQELFQIVRVKKYHTFEELIANHGHGTGCEICKPAVASILASLWNEFVGSGQLETLQDTNDRFLANIQRGGLYSVVPRIPGGEITPEKLIVLGEVARRYGLYTKITGGQRIDLFGAHVHDLPSIWSELIAAGFESGHAYGKAVRTVKSCVGSTWCRYGVQDSVGYAIRVEDRYKGIRAPHKIKMAVSGCVRECAEAQCKDVGLIATEHGWNLYVCGNGGAKPRHADLFATDLDDETAIRYIDRVLMYYIHTADRLTRTATWLENLEGGIDHLRDVVIRDTLQICDQLDADMERLVASYACEWAAVVNDPEKQARFREHLNVDGPGSAIELIEQRGQRRPADWPRSVPVVSDSPALFGWLDAGAVEDFPLNGGASVRVGEADVAIFNMGNRAQWYATSGICPHMNEPVLARGIVGDECGVPKVACPFHKKTFSLEDGSCLSGDAASIKTYDIRIVDGRVQIASRPAALGTRPMPKQTAELSAT